MKRLISYQAIFICLLMILSIYTPAQNSEQPKSNSEKKSSELPLVGGATSLTLVPAATLSDGNDREGRRSADTKAENANGDQPSIRFVLNKQPLWALNAAADREPQAAGQPQQDMSKVAGTVNKEQDKNGELIIAPYPITSPALGTGLQWVAGYVFRTNKEDKVTPPSFFGTAGMYTNNGSWAALLGGLFYLKQDKYRVVGALAPGDVNFDFYGIGKLAGDRGVFLPISVNGKGILVQTLVRIAKNLYLGPRFQLRQLNAEINFSELKLQIDKLP